MGREHLLRDEKPKHYPRQHGPDPDRELNLGLVRRVPVRPGRFLMGFDGKRPLSPPRDQVNGIPLSVASYVGRVEEIDGDGEVTVRVWARPSGWEGLTTLDAGKPTFEREPSVGDLLWIWTWIDVLSDRSEEKRIYVEVEHRQLVETDRMRLRALAAKLREEP